MDRRATAAINGGSSRSTCRPTHASSRTAAGQAATSITEAAWPRFRIRAAADGIEIARTRHQYVAIEVGALPDQLPFPEATFDTSQRSTSSTRRRGRVGAVDALIHLVKPWRVHRITGPTHSIPTGSQTADCSTCGGTQSPTCGRCAESQRALAASISVRSTSILSLSITFAVRLCRTALAPQSSAVTSPSVAEVAAAHATIGMNIGGMLTSE